MKVETLNQVITLLILAAGMSLVFLVGGFIADYFDNRSNP